jgi:hypothetical protein
VVNINASQNAIAKVSKLGKAFVYVIINRIYYLVAIPAMYITYNVFKALDTKDSTGKSIIDNISDIISGVIKDITDISHECPTLIHDFPRFLDCLGF